MFRLSSQLASLCYQVSSRKFAFNMVVVTLCCQAVAHADGIAVKSGDKIAFLGDSNTQLNSVHPSGWTRLVISGLEVNGVKAEPVFAGASGNRSPQMLERLERDVLSKKPQWMVFSCGVNDVWHPTLGVPLDQYKKSMTAIVEQAQAAGIQVVIMSQSVIGEDIRQASNKKLDQYNDFLYSLAKEKHCRVADVGAEMRVILQLPEGAPPRKINLLTTDGAHFNIAGNQLVAVNVLKTLGLNEDQLKKAGTYWLDIPKAVELDSKIAVTLREYDQLRKLAESRGSSVQDVLNERLNKSVQDLLQEGR